VKYLLLSISDESGWQKMSDEQRAQGIAAFGGYIEALNSAGVLVGNYRPEPSFKAKTVTVDKDKLRVSDGPFAKNGDQLTGLYVIDVPDLDAALSWAERNPAARFGTIEVRPVANPAG
jgi:hypothetical protein